MGKINFNLTEGFEGLWQNHRTHFAGRSDQKLEKNTFLQEITVGELWAQPGVDGSAIFLLVKLWIIIPSWNPPFKHGQQYQQSTGTNPGNHQNFLAPWSRGLEVV